MTGNVPRPHTRRERASTTRSRGAAKIRQAPSEMLLTARPSQVTQAVCAMHPSSFGCVSRRRPPDRDPEERQRRLELVSGGHLNAPPLPSVDTDRLTRGVRVLTVFPSPPLDLTWGFVLPALGSANLRAGLRKERVRAPLDPMLTPAIRPDEHGRGRAPRGDAPCRRPGGEYARAPRRDGCAHGCGWRGDVPSSLPDGGSASRGSACGDASGRHA